jgi:hypothetical protein
MVFRFLYGPTDRVKGQYLRFRISPRSSRFKLEMPTMGNKYFCDGTVSRRAL